jgi:hypothetical protein
MIRYEYNSENFDSTTSKDYTLSILIGMDSLVFTISDHHSAILVVKDFFLSENVDTPSWFSKLKETLNAEKKLYELEYKQVKVLIAGNEFVFVPERLFEPNAANVYLEQAIGLSNNNTVGFNEYPDLHSNIVYSMPEDVIQLIRQQHPAATVEHISNGLRNAYLNFSAHQPEAFLGLHFRGSLEYITFFQNGFVRFHHCYKVTEGQNGLYFLLLVADSLQLDTESTPVVWSGDLVADANLLNLVQRYFRTVNKIDIGPFDTRGFEEEKYLEIIGSIAQ